MKKTYSIVHLRLQVVVRLFHNTAEEQAKMDYTRQDHVNTFIGAAERTSTFSLAAVLLASSRQAP